MATAPAEIKTVTRTVEVEETVVTLELTGQEARDLRRVLALIDSLSEHNGNRVLKELADAKDFAGSLWEVLFDARTGDVPLYPSWDESGKGA